MIYLICHTYHIICVDLYNSIYIYVLSFHFMIWGYLKSSISQKSEAKELVRLLLPGRTGRTGRTISVEEVVAVLIKAIGACMFG